MSNKLINFIDFNNWNYFDWIVFVIAIIIGIIPYLLVQLILYALNKNLRLGNIVFLIIIVVLYTYITYNWIMQ